MGSEKGINRLAEGRKISRCKWRDSEERREMWMKKRWVKGRKRERGK